MFVANVKKVSLRLEGYGANATDILQTTSIVLDDAKNVDTMLVSVSYFF